MELLTDTDTKNTLVDTPLYIVNSCYAIQPCWILNSRLDIVSEKTALIQSCPSKHDFLVPERGNRPSSRWFSPLNLGTRYEDRSIP